MGLSPGRRLETLPTRPPTPPRDVEKGIADALEYLDSSFETARPLAESIEAQSPFNSPPEPTPPSSSLNGSGRRKKRVDFSPWMNYHKAPVYARFPPNERVLRSLPQTRLQKPLKSILKSQTPPVFSSDDNSGSPGPGLTHRLQPLPEMLETIARQLGEEGVSQRLDAYISLLTTLKAYDEQPDTGALLKKLELLQIYIRRDLMAHNPTTQALDARLIGQAAKLLAALMRLPRILNALDDDFCVFIIERSIDVIKDPNMAKAIVTHHLVLLSQQKFNQRVMTAARGEKILDAMKNLEDRIKGNGVFGARLLVYQTLLIQLPNTMMAKMNDWFGDVFHGMLSDIADIRTRAIDLGMASGKALGHNGHAAKVVTELLDRTVQPEAAYANYLATRIENMLVDETTATQAPQIWTVVVLHLRGLRTKLENWRHLKLWLNTFQTMVNNGKAKAPSYTAWNQFIFVVYPVAKTLPVMRRLLLTPIHVGLIQKQQTKLSKATRRAAIISFYTLLYYSCRPSASYEGLDNCWNDYISAVLSKWVTTDQKDADKACRILIALLSNTASKPWNEDRSLEGTYIQLDELPRLNPSWIRDRMPIILQLIRPCLDNGSWDCGASTKSHVKELWSCLIDAIDDAGCKEIKASVKLKEAIAHIMNLFHNLWAESAASLGCNDVDSKEVWLERFHFLVETAMQKLGPANFADRILARTSDSGFEAAPTPSSRTKGSPTLQSPLLHLLLLLLGPDSDRVSSAGRVHLGQAILRQCWESKATRHQKLEFLNECTIVINENSSCDKTGTHKAIWETIVSLADTTLKETGSNASKQPTQQLGDDYHCAVGIIAGGIHQSPQDSLLSGQNLLHTLIETVRTEGGEGAVALVITDPLAALIGTKIEPKYLNACMGYLTTLLQSAPHPKTRRALEQGRKAIGHPTPNNTKAMDFEPYDHYWTTIDYVMVEMYRILETGSDVSQGVAFGAAVGASLESMPAAFILSFLRNIQPGVSVWTEDKEQKLNRFPDMVSMITGLWPKICSAVERLPRKDSMLLKSLHMLINSGFRSRRRRIVNDCINFWNTTFGSEDTIEYPIDIEQSLRRLKGVAELKLPSFPEGSANDNDVESPSFESDEDSEKPSTPIRSRLPTSRSIVTRSAARQPSARKTRAMTSKETVKPKLRHDDSQIQFEFIQSDSGGISTVDSQSLTERQKEVRARQLKRNPGLFPGLSSSPDQPSVSPLVKRPIRRTHASIDEELQSDHADTPTGVTPSLRPYERFLDSSPTPRSSSSRRSNRSHTGTPMPARRTRLSERLASPPSSPPHPIENDESRSVLAGNESVTNVEFVKDSFEDKSTPISKQEEKATELQTKLAAPQDQLSPTENDGPEVYFDASQELEDQLQKSAAMSMDEEACPTPVEGTVHSTIEAMHSKKSEDNNNSFVASTIAETDEEISCIKDSFVDSLGANQNESEATVSHDTSQIAMTEASRKRRSSSPPSQRRSKRVKRQSPLKKLVTSVIRTFSGARETGEEEKEATNVLDCIVVATPDTTTPVTSLHTGPPTQDGPTQEATQPGPSNTITSAPDSVVEASSSSRSSQTRKRPRHEDNSNTDPQPNRDEPLPQRRVTRRSAIGLGSASLDVSTPVAMEKVPATKRHRTDVSRPVTRASGSSVTPAESTLVSVRAENSNYVSKSVKAAEQQEASNPSCDKAGSSKRQADLLDVPSTPRRATTMAERVILTPRSIMGRLRQLLTDCQTLVLGTQEERELDDALFEIRKEVHEAGRRGQKSE